MSTAIAVLAIGEGYLSGARVLFHTLRKRGCLPGSVHCYTVGDQSLDLASVNHFPILSDYSDIEVNQTYFPEVAKKFEALRLLNEYDQLILMDADTLCVGDCSYLWSTSTRSLPFYACRDTASVKYYGESIGEIGLDRHMLFNAGVMIFNRANLPPYFRSHLMEFIRTKGKAYDGGDQGYLNHYFQSMYNEIGVLPAEYCESYDQFMPSLPAHAQRIIHFTGPNANPWAPKVGIHDPRRRWFQRWQEEFKETAQ